jgi:NADPH-dependent glutamate synthase beta subunit-like oxidoreductase/NAD-dependent dihydropyrimidine dehydrogenase PreA subunit
VQTDARGYVRAIAQGDFEQAYLIARGPNPLASICGRVCGAPCEAACRRGSIDQAVSIRALKRFVTERHGTEARGLNPLELLGRVINNTTKRQCEAQEELGGLRRLLRHIEAPPSDAKRVAIIGSGPAGLAAAHDLALLGVRPVVFEMEPVPAGMLAVGIPEYRLPRDLIRAEVELIESLGVEFRCNTQIGKDITLDQIRSEFSATIIAVGAKRSRLVPVPGNEGAGVLGGVEFLRDLALGNPVELGSRIIVIGGGNVAYDVSRSVVRQTGVDVSRSAMRQAGVGDVHMVSLESLDEMPADDAEILEGDEEGIIRHHRLGPNRVVRDDAGKVTGLELQRCTRVFDENGRFAPTFDESDLTTIPGDTVIWAIGQQPNLSFIPGGGDVRLTERGMIECNASELTTSAPDVFVAGDIAHGARLLIDAVASGKRAARSVYHFITGKQISADQVVLHLPIIEYARERDYEKQERIEVPTLSAEQRKHSQTAQVETGYTPEMAMCEAGRCLDCGVNTIFDSDKCILCGGCADICPELCLRLVSVASLARSGELEPVLDARFDADELKGASAIIKDEERCIRCGLCAVRCPADAITMERMTFEQPWSEAVA